MLRPSTHHDARQHHREPHGGPRPDHLPRFGLRGPFARGGWGRGRARRGEIRPLILAVLAEKPMHGYEVIQALESRSGGRWRPSAGSVYPTLQLLSDEGLVTSEELDGRRVYTLTEAGRAASAANPVPSPWAGDGGTDTTGLPQAGMQLMDAIMQVDRVGSIRARRETLRILGDARRQVYRLLADDDAVPTGEPFTAPADAPTGDPGEPA